MFEVIIKYAKQILSLFTGLVSLISGNKDN